jgi:hypothetical protein
MPWILLQIFLDYASNFSPSDTAVMRTLVNMTGGKGSTPPAGGGGSQPPGGGAMINLPFAKRFNIPKDLGPTGAAKTLQINADKVETRFAQPTYVPQMQVNAQVLTATNLSIPSIRDIARFDTATVSNNASQRQEITQLRETLERIANPANIESQTDRDRYVEIHEKLIQESQQGNVLATSILKAADQTSQMSTTQIKNILQQIANPATSTSVIDKERLSNMHQMLEHESKENNSQLASTLLSVNEKTTSSEIEKIRETLLQAQSNSKESTVANSVLSTINNTAHQTQAATQVKTVLQQVANPNSVTNIADKEKLSKLHESLENASKQGNDLATSILSVSPKTPISDIAKLQERIMQSKGQPIANEIAAMTKKATETTLPTTNRVQTVSQQDYQAVKDMWRDNYHKLEVPQGMAGTREDWIKDDVNRIDSIVKLLSSTNPDEVKQGLDQVSNILPFLMIGGFSQTEIVAYLKAKQEAAKEVSVELAKEEEEKVTVEVKHTAAQGTMAAAMSEPEPSPASSINSSSPSADEEASDSPLSNLSAVTVEPQTNNEILTTVNVKLPKLQDVAKYESMSLSHDKAKFADVQKIHEVLEQIADPGKVTDGSEREKFASLHTKLLDAKSKGDATANAFLSAASVVGQTDGAVVVPAIPTTSTNQIAQSDYDEVKKMWEENYRTLPVPSGFSNDNKGRIDWIKADASELQQTIELLNAPETEKKNEGVRKIAGILPFLLLGGFSYTDMAKYLTIKVEAGETVRKALEEEESKMISVPTAAQQEEQKEMSAQAENENKDQNNR